ncbi:hypothetical protein [Thermobispora bispora]|uniref:Uncharacterized protein n=2 Tax=Thermobispora bispora TaxID=2006 RepID=D6Y421_THEBD|nr:hypothetical protein [Thermobispora bispora]ADG89123.1 hypothetical protein Tbis_2420 [Thermobispora bispora DSM 43833]MDI9579754.1 hypothetical protein [Thermobispora sp.]
MRRVVPSHAKVRDITTAARRRPRRDEGENVIDLRAYAGRNVIRFPRTPGRPTPAA